MPIKFLSFLAITLLSIAPLWARATAVVEREFDAFKAKASVNPKVGKAEQFLEKLTADRQADDIIAMLNKGEGVRGFSKKNRKLTDEEAKIALNALFFAKRNKLGVFPFKEGIDDYGLPAVQRHRHFIKVAWRLLDPALGYVNTGTNFKTDDRAYREFRALVRTQMQFETTGFEAYGPYQGEGGIYIDNGVGTTKQYGLELPRAPFFHVYHPIQFEDFEDAGSVSSTVRLRIPTREMRQHLPDNVKREVSRVSDENLDIYVVSQNLPWKDELAILYRPQYWLDPEAPFEQAGYNHEFQVSLLAYPTPQGKTISGEEGHHNINVNSHTEEGTNWIVSSGSIPSADGVLKEDVIENDELKKKKIKKNYSFYSLTKTNNVIAYEPATGTIQTPDRYALTLHLILNRAGSQRIGQIAQTLSTTWFKKIYHLSEMLDADPVLSQLHRLGF